MAARGTRGRFGTRAPGRGALALLAAVCLSPGCDVGTPPPPPPAPDLAGVTYYPDLALVDVPCGTHLDFAVREGDRDLRSVTWRTASGQTGRGPRFRYFATAWLPDTVWTDVTGADAAGTRRWVVDTTAGFQEAGFTPADDELTLFWSTEQDFAVTAVCEPLAVAWDRDDAAAGAGTRYTFTADQSGEHAVRARVTLPDTVVERTWTVHVLEPGAAFAWSPAPERVQIYESMNQYFEVVTDAPLPSAVWTVDGVEAGTGARFGFPGHAVGTYGIAVTVVLPETTVRHAWTLEVVAAEQGAPPAVTGLTVEPAAELGVVRVAWPASAPGAFDLEAYEVRWSPDGPLTAENWLRARPLGPGAWTAGDPAYAVDLWYEDMNWRTGDEAWFAVRARDTRGLRSDIAASPRLRVDLDWWIEGRVIGPQGGPQAAVRVRDFWSDRAVATDADGRYRIGPFLPVEEPDLRYAGTDPASGSPWSPQASGAMAWDGTRRHDVRLIPDLGTDPTCYAFHENFTRYLRVMTKTFNPLSLRPNVELYKWDRYPVDIHVPAWTSPRTGIDYGGNLREAVAIWNDSMGEPYLRLVDAPPDTGIVVRFDVDDPMAAARSRLLQPGDGELALALAVPVLVGVDFTDVFPDEVRLLETAIHELGHCLGLYAHAYCNETDYVMNVSSAGALDDGPENAIHPDERNAVRMIRILPQGLDMSPYSME